MKIIINFDQATGSMDYELPASITTSDLLLISKCIELVAEKRLKTCFRDRESEDKQ